MDGRSPDVATENGATALTYEKSAEKTHIASIKEASVQTSELARSLPSTPATLPIIDRVHALNTKLERTLAQISETAAASYGESNKIKFADPRGGFTIRLPGGTLLKVADRIAIVSIQQAINTVSDWFSSELKKLELEMEPVVVPIVKRALADALLPLADQTKLSTQQQQIATQLSDSATHLTWHTVSTFSELEVLVRTIAIEYHHATHTIQNILDGRQPLSEPIKNTWIQLFNSMRSCQGELKRAMTASMAMHHQIETEHRQQIQRHIFSHFQVQTSAPRELSTSHAEAIAERNGEYLIGVKIGNVDYELGITIRPDPATTPPGVILFLTSITRASTHGPKLTDLARHFHHDPKNITSAKQLEKAYGMIELYIKHAEAKANNRKPLHTMLRGVSVAAALVFGGWGLWTGQKSTSTHATTTTTTHATTAPRPTQRTIATPVLHHRAPAPRVEAPAPVTAPVATPATIHTYSVASATHANDQYFLAQAIADGHIRVSGSRHTAADWLASKRPDSPLSVARSAALEEFRSLIRKDRQHQIDPEHNPALTPTESHRFDFWTNRHGSIHTRIGDTFVIRQTSTEYIFDHCDADGNILYSLPITDENFGAGRDAAQHASHHTNSTVTVGRANFSVTHGTQAVSHTETGTFTHLQVAHSSPPNSTPSTSPQTAHTEVTDNDDTLADLDRIATLLRSSNSQPSRGSGGDTKYLDPESIAILELTRNDDLMPWNQGMLPPIGLFSTPPPADTRYASAAEASHLLASLETERKHQTRGFFQRILGRVRNIFA